jgi:drug/metabolite transporter (DMT)-like permease
MLAGVASFVANDALVKIVSETMPTSQLMAVRGLFATAMLVAFCIAMRVRLPLHAFADRKVLLRAGLDALSSVTYVAALAHLALANATAINMTTPLLLSLLAVLALGERVTVRTWVAIVAGFAGVLLIVQPTGAAFNAWSLVVLASTFFLACRDLVTRNISRDIPSVQVTLASVLLIMALCALWGVTQEWRPFGLRETGALLAAAVLMSCGYVFLTVAFREGTVSAVSPFRYAAPLLSSMLGFVIWHDVPNAVAWCGMIIMIVSGIYLVRSR